MTEKSIQIPIEDLEDTIAVLHLTMSAYQSEDVAEAYNNLQQTINYRPLTNELSRIHERLSGFLKDYVYETYQEDDQEEEEDA
jgi:hypothetical protein